MNNSKLSRYFKTIKVVKRDASLINKWSRWWWSHTYATICINIWTKIYTCLYSISTACIITHPGDSAYQAPPGYQLVPQQEHSSMYIPSTTPPSQYSSAYNGAPYIGQGGGRNHQMIVIYVSVILNTPVI
jgi:hypothetical protein